MGHKFHGKAETPILTSAFSTGLATGLRNGELNTGDRNFLRKLVHLSDHDIAHIAHASKPPVKAHPHLWANFDV